MFAIFKTGGKQLKASIGDKLYIEKIDAEVGDTYGFSQVLMIDGKIGAPLLVGAGVKAVVIKHGKDKKLKVVRYRPKKNINKIYGHRQPYTLVEVTEIVESGIDKDGVVKKAPKALATKDKEKKEQKAIELNNDQQQSDNNQVQPSKKASAKAPKKLDDAENKPTADVPTDNE